MYNFLNFKMYPPHLRRVWIGYASNIGKSERVACLNIHIHIHSYKEVANGCCQIHSQFEYEKPGSNPNPNQMRNYQFRFGADIH